MSITDMQELLGLPVVGVIPESKDVLTCTNLGNPVITMSDQVPAAGAFQDMVDRYLGEDKPLRYTVAEPDSIFKRIFG